MFKVSKCTRTITDIVAKDHKTELKWLHKNKLNEFMLSSVHGCPWSSHNYSVRKHNIRERNI